MSTNKFDEKTLIGQTFGDYTILDAYRTNPGNKIRVLCRCVCGWQGERAYHNGVKKHDQCRLKRGYKAEDVIGQKYGRLTIVEAWREKTNVNKQPKRLFCRCECECGKEKITTYRSLIRGNTQSCGCLHNERRIIAANNSPFFVEGTIVTRLAKSKGLTARNSSGFTGVGFNKNAKKWSAYITFAGKQHFLGYFSDINEAIAARKKAEEVYFKPVLEQNKDKLEHVSSCIGVCWTSRYQKWKAEISVHGKSYSLGSYEKEEDAIRARKEAEIKYLGYELKDS